MPTAIPKHSLNFYIWCLLPSLTLFSQADKS